MRNLLTLSVFILFFISCDNSSETTNNDDRSTTNTTTSVTNSNTDETSTTVPSDKRFKIVSAVTDKNTSYYTINNSVALYSKAEKGSSKLAELDVATSVNIINKTTITDTEQGYEAPWYEVEVAGKKGFIWSGHLSSIAMEANINATPEEEIIMLINKTVDPNISGSDNNHYIVKVIQESSVVAELKMDTYFGLDFTNLSFKKIEGFSPPLFAVEAGYNFKGEVSGDGLEYFSFNKNSLKSLLKVNTTEGEGDYNCQTEVVYPKAERGVDNKIILNQACGETGSTDLDKEQFIYTWDGKILSRGN